MKEYGLESCLPPERLWERLIKMSGEPVHGQMGARAYKLTIKPLKEYQFCAVLDIWKLADPDAYGWPLDTKRNQYETQLRFHGTVTPQGQSSKLTGKFQFSGREMLICICGVFVMTGVLALKFPSLRTPKRIFLLLAFFFAGGAAVYFARSMGGDEVTNYEREWLLRLLEDHLLHL